MEQAYDTKRGTTAGLYGIDGRGLVPEMLPMENEATGNPGEPLPLFEIQAPYIAGYPSKEGTTPQT